MKKKLHNGKLYLLSNASWNNLKKIGVAQNTKIRIKTMQSGLPNDISILYESDTLVDKFFYEYLLSKILYKFRYRKDREFYEIETNDFIQFISTIEVMNKLYNTEEKLIDFIQQFDNEYYQKRFKNKKNLYVCTIY